MYGGVCVCTCSPSYIHKTSLVTVHTSYSRVSEVTQYRRINMMIIIKTSLVTVHTTYSRVSGVTPY